MSTLLLPSKSLQVPIRAGSKVVLLSVARGATESRSPQAVVNRLAAKMDISHKVLLENKVNMENLLLQKNSAANQKAGNQELRILTDHVSVSLSGDLSFQESSQERFCKAQASGPSTILKLLWISPIFSVMHKVQKGPVIQTTIKFCKGFIGPGHFL